MSSVSKNESNKVYIVQVQGPLPDMAQGSMNVIQLASSDTCGFKNHNIARVVLAPNGGHDSHYHPEAEESIYVLDGLAQVIIGKQESIVEKGKLIAILPNVSHEIRNASKDELLDLLVVSAPHWTPDCSVSAK